MRPQLGDWVEQREGLTGTKADRRRAKEIRKGWAWGRDRRGHQGHGPQDWNGTWSPNTLL